MLDLSGAAATAALRRRLEDWVIRDASPGFGVRGRAARAGGSASGSRRPGGARGQDRRDRRAGAALGELPRDRLNVAPDLGHFAGIVPCGIAEHGVTSLADLGVPATLGDVDEALRATFPEVFGAAAAGVAA